MTSQSHISVGTSVPDDSPQSSARADSARLEVRQDLREQQALIIQACTIPLIVFGTLWTALVAAASLSGTDPTVTAAVPPGLMVIVGCLAYDFGRRGNVRAAAYVLAVALVANASAGLTLLSNAEIPAIIAYCVAMSVAAIIIPARELIVFATFLVATALAAALSHHFPIVDQSAVPANLMAAGTVVAIVLGLPFPMVMFWLFSRSLESSYTEAWRAAQEAAATMKQAEDHKTELARLARRLQHKNAELSDFLYVFSHNMRAPLINLEGFSRGLQASLATLLRTVDQEPLSDPARAQVAEVTPDLEESLGYILDSVARTDFLVSSVLEVARIETREEQSVETDLAELIPDIVATLQAQLDDLDGSVEIDGMPVICGDPVLIHQLFANLLENAIKYSRPQVPPQIRILHSDHPDGHHFAVSDNGVGIRTEDIPKVFRMFGRLGHSNERGNGVGLTVIKKIIERRGGHIWVESTLSQGSTFHFTWPTYRPTESTAEEQLEDAAA